MKIIQISAVYKVGSVGRIVESIHSYLLSKDLNSYVLYGLGHKNNDRNVIKITTRFESFFSHVYYLITGINFAGCFFATKKAIHIIKKMNPDIVHIHCFNDYYINVHKLFKWLKKNNKKTFITQHAEHYYTGSCGYSLNCTKWMHSGCDNHCHFFSKHLSGYPYFDRTKTLWKKMKKSLSDFDKQNLIFVSCTPWLDKRLKQSTILNDVKKHYVIFNGANSNTFKYNKVPDAPIIILYVTPRFSDGIKGSKNINTIANKFINDKKIEFHIVGDVPPEYNLSENIKKIGKLNPCELAKEYSKATITIMLSKAECFPMVCVESLLCGTKIVAFKCGGPDDVYDNNFASFIDWGDFDSMHDKIYEIINTGYDKKALSEKAKELYSDKTMSHNYYLLYEREK